MSQIAQSTHKGSKKKDLSLLTETEEREMIERIERLDAPPFPFDLIAMLVTWIIETIVTVAKSDYLERKSICLAYKFSLWKYPAYASRLFHACCTLLQRRVYFLIVAFIFLSLWIDIQRQLLWPLLWDSETGSIYINPLNWNNHGFFFFGTTMRVIIWSIYWIVAYSFTGATTIVGAMFIPIVVEMGLQFVAFPSKKKLMTEITRVYTDSCRWTPQQAESKVSFHGFVKL
jgi:hypothetical protein